MPMEQTTLDPAFEAALTGLGEGPLDEARLRRHLFPLFSRVLERDEIYLANHSLGRPADRMAEDVQHALDAWYRDMDGAWELWMEEIGRFRAQVARLLGLSRADAVVPKTNAGQGLRAVLNAIPRDRVRVVTTRGEFDSVDFILKAYAQRGRAEVVWAEPDEAGMFHAEQLLDLCARGTDLLVVSQVYYATGQHLTGLRELIRSAQERGVLVMVDVYHAAGVLPVEMEALGADFTIGGCYKYLRGGPGACWLAIHPRHLEDGAGEGGGRFGVLDTGWFAKRDVFSFARAETPDYAPGGDGWLESTPPILTAFQAKAGLELTLGLGVERLRAYNRHQQEILAESLRSNGVEPVLLDERGAFLLVRSADAPGMCERLAARGVKADARMGFVRLCPDVLNTEEELERAGSLFRVG